MCDCYLPGITHPRNLHRSRRWDNDNCGGGVWKCQCFCASFKKTKSSTNLSLNLKMLHVHCGMKMQPHVPEVRALAWLLSRTTTQRQMPAFRAFLRMTACVLSWVSRVIRHTHLHNWSQRHTPHLHLCLLLCCGVVRWEEIKSIAKSS